MIQILVKDKGKMDWRNLTPKEWTLRYPDIFEMWLMDVKGIFDIVQVWIHDEPYLGSDNDLLVMWWEKGDGGPKWEFWSEVVKLIDFFNNNATEANNFLEQREFFSSLHDIGWKDEKKGEVA